MAQKSYKTLTPHPLPAYRSRGQGDTCDCLGGMCDVRLRILPFLWGAATLEVGAVAIQGVWA
jgi:hypothetical protein